ncbi:MAG: cysteine desulfurase [Lachnospiraceae bacterium]|nr:cysteine desulfurase [Lachnospiraceae bacterium]
MREIYLDNAATTRVLPEAADAASAAMREQYGNPSSLHHKGFEAEQYVKNARKAIAGSLKVPEETIVFTSGGTESNNMALLCGADARKRYGNHIITTRIEHASVYQPILHLQDLGYRVTFLEVDANGIVSPETLAAALTDDTILVSVMAVNNEIGAVEPVAELAALVHEKTPNAWFHTDAIQAYGKIPLYPKRMGIDLLSVSGHKLHAPKGTGFLYVREKLAIKPLIYGGGQQKDLRSGTENVPGIAGLGAAVSNWFADAERKRSHLYELKEQFVTLVSEVPGATVNGVFSDVITETLAERIRKTAPHIVSVSFRGVRSEVLLHALEDKGIYVSSGSACSSNHPAISGTLKAIGVENALLDSTLRFSFSYETTEEEIRLAAEALKELVPVLGRYRRS